MIDFHSHVLPKIDDGAKNVETSLRMLEESKRQGVKTIVCTPHYYGRKRSPEAMVKKRQDAYAMIAEQVPEGLEIRFGSEVFFSKDTVVKAEELSMLCIEGTRYIMLELPMQAKYDQRLFDKIESFIYETDCIPVIAHVDRYPAVQRKPSILKRLAELGCLFQLNAEAFEAKGVKSLAYALLRKGMVHAIGSDMHNDEDRAPNMKIAREALSLLPAEVEERITAMEQAILSDEKIVPEVKSIHKLFGKYF